MGGGSSLPKTQTETKDDRAVIGIAGGERDAFDFGYSQHFTGASFWHDQSFSTH